MNIMILTINCLFFYKPLGLFCVIPGLISGTLCIVIGYLFTLFLFWIFFGKILGLEVEISDTVIEGVYWGI